MSNITPNILETPLEIYNAVLDHFPKTQATIEINRGGFVMKLNVSKSAPLISLRHAVDAKEFLQQMKELHQRVKIDKFCDEQDLDAIEVKIFSLLQPLANWQKYRRVMFEKEGNDSQNEIMKFLQGSDNLSILFHLGLAPEQVEITMLEGDLVYFRKIFEKIKTMSEEERKLILSNLQKQYPNVCKKFLDEFARVKLEEELQTKDTFYQGTLKKLREQVIGQNQATKALAALLTTQNDAFTDNKVFIFVGPTGVGKTQLAKAVSSIKNNRFIFFSMNQYQNDMSLGKFFGSGTGFIGSTDLPPLAKELSRYAVKSRTEDFKTFHEVKDVVILFDEFEKAHQTIKQSMLTVFDEGSWSNEYSKPPSPESSSAYAKNLVLIYTFKSCIIINTSNLYQDEILRAFLSKMTTSNISKMFVDLNSTRPLETSLSKELLGRMSVIPFGPIPEGECYQRLLKSKMEEFLKMLKLKMSCKDIEVENELLILLALEKKLYGQGIDIRRVNRYFENVRDAISRTKHEWGDMKTKKLIFSHDGTKFFIKILTFLQDLDIFHDSGIPILILP